MLNLFKLYTSAPLPPPPMCKAPAGPPPAHPSATKLRKALAVADKDAHCFRSAGEVWRDVMRAEIDAFSERCAQSMERREAVNQYDRSATHVFTERAKALRGRGWQAAYWARYKYPSSMFSAHMDAERAVNCLTDETERDWWYKTLALDVMDDRCPIKRQKREVQAILDASPFEGEDKR